MGSPGWKPTAGELRARESGTRRPLSFRASVSRRQCDAAALSGDKTIAHRWSGGVNCLELDETERRYLLAGTVDAVVAVYDTEQPTKTDRTTGHATHEPLIRVAKGSAEGAEGGATNGGARGTGGHLFSVSCAAWYPIDTGMFFTGSFDQTVAAWDTNTASRVLTFHFDAKVYHISMAPNANSHCLVAVGTGHPQVRLCDPNSGNVTHTLTGHREAVWATRWMRGSEWILATGGGDGDVRLWDIRRAGSFMRLDASNVRVGEVDALEEALEAPDRGFIPAGPAPLTRRNVDSVPAHLFSDDAVRCGGSGWGGTSGGTLSRRRYRGGAYGDAAYVAGGSGGGGWGQGFRGRRGGASVDGTAGTAGGHRAVTRAGRGAHDGRVTALQITPDGLYLASAGTDGRVRVWDLSDGRNMEMDFGYVPNDARKATQLGVSRDGSRLYCPSSDGDVFVFDTFGARRKEGDRGDGDDEDDNEKEKVRRTERAGGRHGRGAGDRGRRGRFVRKGRDDDEDDDEEGKKRLTPRPFRTLKGHITAACAVAVNGHTSEVYTGGADRHVLVWRPPPPPRHAEEEDAGRRSNGAADDGEVGVYRPFRANAEHRRLTSGVVARTTGNADDWSDDDGVHPDPDARWGIHGLGYRRAWDQ